MIKLIVFGLCLATLSVLYGYYPSAFITKALIIFLAGWTIYWAIKLFRSLPAAPFLDITKGYIPFVPSEEARRLGKILGEIFSGKPKSDDQSKNSK